MTPDRRKVVEEREECEGSIEYAEEQFDMAKDRLLTVQRMCPHPVTKTFCLEGGGWVTICEDCHHSRDATNEEIAGVKTLA